MPTNKSDYCKEYAINKKKIDKARIETLRKWKHKRPSITSSDLLRLSPEKFIRKIEEIVDGDVTVTRSY